MLSSHLHYNDCKMAFVFGKAEKLIQLEPRQQFPGPADYLTRTTHHKEETPAPFNSSAFKVSSFDVPPSQTGPGLYDPLTQKELQTSHKKTHMNSSFCSNVQRFKTEPNATERHKDAQMRVSLIAEESSKVEQGG